MVLGKKYDPEQDAMYKQVVGVETRGLEVEKRLVGLEEELEGITGGHLDRGLHSQALNNIKKRSAAAGEECMRMMEVLDGIILNEDQQGK